MSEIRNRSAAGLVLSKRARAALHDSPSPAFLSSSRKVLRGRHARANRLLGWFDMDVPVGTIRVVHDGVLVHLVTNDPDEFEQRTDAVFGFEPPATQAEELAVSLRRVFAGQAVPTDFAYLDTLPPFQQRVLVATSRIPRGEVRPYQWVAREAGTVLAVRATGTALGHNPVPFLVPCHRVVRSDWTIGQYSAAGGAATKLAVLRWESCSIDRLAAAQRGHLQAVGDFGTNEFCLPVCPRVDGIAPGDRRDFRRIDDALTEGMAPCGHCRPIGLP